MPMRTKSTPVILRAQVSTTVSALNSRTQAQHSHSLVLAMPGQVHPNPVGRGSGADPGVGRSPVRSKPPKPSLRSDLHLHPVRDLVVQEKRVAAYFPFYMYIAARVGDRAPCPL